MVVATVAFSLGRGRRDRRRRKASSRCPTFRRRRSCRTAPRPTTARRRRSPSRQEADSKVEEFRTKNGKLYAVRVTPRIGKPYLLIDPDGKGTMTNAGEINGGVKAPQWTIFEF